MTQDRTKPADLTAIEASEQLSTLYFSRQINVPLKTLWHVVLEPAPRKIWGTPSADISVEILQSSTEVGGKEILLCKAPNAPEFQVESGWLEIVPFEKCVCYEVVAAENIKLAAALMTWNFAGNETSSQLEVGLQISSFGRSMTQDYQTGYDAGLANLASVAERTMLIEWHMPFSREKVWNAWMNADNLPKWWGPDGFSCNTRKIDLSSGGEWIFDMIGPDGTVYPNHHLYHDISPKERFNYSLLWGENGPKHADAWASFTDESNGTLVTLGMIFATFEEWQEAKSFGAAQLGQQTLGKLERNLRMNSQR